MKFSKIGKHTIRCVISEQEIQDLGYTIEEIMSNGERTQEFMNQIFDMAEQSFETKFELGIKTVRADFMSDHTLALTFSEHPGSDEMMEHLKDIVNGLMNAIPQQKWAQINEARQNEGNPDQVPVYATIVFADFDRLLRYAKNIMPPDLPTGQLYKYEDRYMLILTFSGMEEGSLRRLSNLTDEYAQDILVQYVRILEGYHLRITNEEEIASTLDKDIKDMIFTDDGKKLFVPIFEKAGWTFNSKHAKKVASWIASGFILKTTLSQRLKDLDSQHFDIIAKNADDIARLEIIPMPIEQKIPKDFNYFQRIVDTRNYYSHYKADDKNVLNFTQMCNTINVLKALIIMILYTHMGMTNDEARKIIIWDEELSFQTMCLRKEGELPNKE